MLLQLNATAMEFYVFVITIRVNMSRLVLGREQDALPEDERPLCEFSLRCKLVDVTYFQLNLC